MVCPKCNGKKVVGPSHNIVRCDLCKGVGQVWDGVAKKLQVNADQSPSKNASNQKTGNAMRTRNKSPEDDSPNTLGVALGVGLLGGDPFTAALVTEITGSELFGCAAGFFGFGDDE